MMSTTRLIPSQIIVRDPVMRYAKAVKARIYGNVKCVCLDTMKYQFERLLKKEYYA